MNKTVFLVQTELERCFIVFDFGGEEHAGIKGNSLPLSYRLYQECAVLGLSSQCLRVACTPKSNATTLLPGTTCTGQVVYRL